MNLTSDRTMTAAAAANEDRTGAVHIAFGAEAFVSSVAFAVDTTRRTITGLAVPWGLVARSGWAKWRFRRGSLVWSEVGRVKLLRDHDFRQAVGVSVTLTETDEGLVATFRVARGAEGDLVLSLAEDGVLDGLSIGVWFDGEGDDWQPDPADETVRLVLRGTLREISITPMPSFDSARVTSVTASATQEHGTPPGAPNPQEGQTMTGPASTIQPNAPGPGGEPVQASATTPPAANTDAAVAQLAAGLTPALVAAVTEAFKHVQWPQQAETEAVPPREPVRAGRGLTEVREKPVYTMNGFGPSLVRDSWNAARGDDDARARLRKFEAQTTELAAETAAAMFASNTSNAAAIIPPGYRPDLYVSQLLQGRPLVSAVSNGGLTDATPFTIPRFKQATGMSSLHTEGVNPTSGTVELEPITVTPRAISGLYTLTREIVDSSNPAIDAIAAQAMGESYSQQTEALLYAELDGVNGQGGTITAGRVPSGAQVTTSASASGQPGGVQLLDAIRAMQAVYSFRRFAAPTRGFLSQEATAQISAAKGDDGRPLLPSSNPSNSAGTSNSVTQAYNVDGLDFQPCWSLTGNASGDTDALIINRADAWAWESPLLTFRYEERNGPANIDLALFGYFAARVLRPVGIGSVRHTQTP